MARLDRVLVCALLLCGAFTFAAPGNAAGDKTTGNTCVACHSRLPGSSFVGAKSHGWKGSIHQKHGVTCDKCHGGDPGASGQREAHAGVFGSGDARSTVFFKNIPSTCGKCHGAEFYKFIQSRHYKRLESEGKGPECVTCHGSMITGILTPDTITAVCEQCHNTRMGIFPYVPEKAKAVLLLLRQSSELLEADAKLYHPAAGTVKARHMLDARSALHSARLDWHKFDLDAIIADLQDLSSSRSKLTSQQ